MCSSDHAPLAVIWYTDHAHVLNICRGKASNTLKYYINNIQCTYTYVQCYIRMYLHHKIRRTANSTREGNVLTSNIKGHHRGQRTSQGSKDIAGVKGHHRGSREAGNHRSKCHKTQYCKLVVVIAGAFLPQHSWHSCGSAPGHAHTEHTNS